MTSRSILLVQWESRVSGSPESARVLIEGLQGAGWQVSVVVGHAGPYVEIYSEAGCDVSVVPHKHWLRKRRWYQVVKDIPQSFRAFRGLKRQIRAVQPDVVYINTIVGPEAAMAARSCGVPVVWHLRDMFDDAGGDMHAPPLIGKSGIRRLIQRLASHVVVVSEAVRRNVVDPIPAGKVSVVQNGVDGRFWTTKRKNAEADTAVTPLVIGVPGTIRPMKGQDFLLKAVAAAADDLGEFEVRITGAGGGEFRRQLEDFVQENGLVDRVQFTGNVDDMAGFLAQCDLAVIPSSCDPLPRTVMESMACGCAVIGTRVGGIPEMIDDGRTGFLVGYGDVVELARCLCDLANDADRRKQLGEAARQHARQEFTVAGYQSTLIRVINDVCGMQSSSTQEDN